MPTLVFLDPCGYKGLSLKLIAGVLGGFGNDCIFFFNYSRINMKLDLAIMNRSVDEFFEPDRAKALRIGIQNKTASEREEIILAAVKSFITEAGGIPTTLLDSRVIRVAAATTWFMPPRTRKPPA